MINIPAILLATEKLLESNLHKGKNMSEKTIRTQRQYSFRIKRQGYLIRGYIAFDSQKDFDTFSLTAFKDDIEVAHHVEHIDRITLPMNLSRRVNRWIKHIKTVEKDLP